MQPRPASRPELRLRRAGREGRREGAREREGRRGAERRRSAGGKGRDGAEGRGARLGVGPARRRPAPALRCAAPRPARRADGTFLGSQPRGVRPPGASDSGGSGPPRPFPRSSSPPRPSPTTLPFKYKTDSSRESLECCWLRGMIQGLTSLDGKALWSPRPSSLPLFRFMGWQGETSREKTDKPSTLRVRKAGGSW